MRKKPFLYNFCCLIIVLFVSACSILNQGNTSEMPIEQQPDDPTAENKPVMTATDPVEPEVTIYLVAVEDSGISGKKIGCDDSLIPVEIITDSILESPWNALETLLRIDANVVSELELYNALDQSNLELVKFETKDNSVEVYIEGEMLLGGVCDTPRVEEQLYATILQGDQFDQVEIYINGELLEDYLSLK